MLGVGLDEIIKEIQRWVVVFNGNVKRCRNVQEQVVTMVPLSLLD